VLSLATWRNVISQRARGAPLQFFPGLAQHSAGAIQVSGVFLFQLCHLPLELFELFPGARQHA